MHRAGYVLTGGLSSRMGADKALLPFEGSPLVLRVAQIVKEAAGSVTLVGGGDRIAHLGLPVIEDGLPGCGPLGGIHAALRATTAEWCLVTACDMPFLNAPFLRSLFELGERFDLAGRESPNAVMARNHNGLAEPLCAVYHTSCFQTVDSALVAGRLKITAALEPLRVAFLDVPRAEWVANANTPDQWNRILKGEVPVD